MPHFLIKKENIKNDIINVKDADLIRHLAKSLRVKHGETIKFIDECEIQYFCEILNVSKTQIEAKILKREKSTRKLNCRLYLAQAVLKSDAQALAVSNATQCGCKGFYPFISDNTVFKKVKNTDKWQKIADEAQKQCERADKMAVYDILPLQGIMAQFTQIIVCAEKNADKTLHEVIKSFDKKEKILVVIGPEGGFSSAEFEYFKSKGANLISLGNLIYKAPNAITAGLSLVSYEVQNAR